MTLIDASSFTASGEVTATANATVLRGSCRFSFEGRRRVAAALVVRFDGTSRLVARVPVSGAQVVLTLTGKNAGRETVHGMETASRRLFGREEL